MHSWGEMSPEGTALGGLWVTPSPTPMGVLCLERACVHPFLVTAQGAKVCLSTVKLRFPSPWAGGAEDTPQGPVFRPLHVLR